MGEHKLREAGNGDEPIKLTTHIAKVIDVLVPWGAPYDNAQADAIEQGFQEIHDRAMQEDSLIMTVTHSVQTYQVLHKETGTFSTRMLVTIVAQRVSRAEWEKQQRLMRMGVK